MQIRFDKIAGSPTNEVVARSADGAVLAVIDRNPGAVKWTASVAGLIGSIGRFPTLRAAKAAVEARLVAEREKAGETRRSIARSTVAFCACSRAAPIRY